MNGWDGEPRTRAGESELQCGLVLFFFFLFLSGCGLLVGPVLNSTRSPGVPFIPPSSVLVGKLSRVSIFY